MSNSSCRACGAPLSVYDRVCDCGALVHATTLAELRTRARIGQMSRDFDMAIGAYQRALQLVPEDHPEHEALSRELDTLLGIANPPADAGSPGAGSSRSGLELRLLLAVTACLLLLLLWPLLSGSLGSPGPSPGGPGGADASGADTSGAGPSRHPASGLLQPDP